MTTRTDTPRGRGETNAPHASPILPEEDIRTVMINRISWGAVLAGVAIALVSQLILNLIGVSIGAASIDPGSNANPSASDVSLGAGIWWALSGIVAAALGGFAAGRLSGEPKESSAGWHGLTSWALTTLVIVYLISSAAGALVGGAANAIGSMTSTVTRTAEPALRSAVGQVVGDTNADPFASIERGLREASGGTDPAALRDTAIASVRAFLTGDRAQQSEARERAAQAVAKSKNVPIEQARTEVAQYEQQYRQTVEQTKQQVEAAADATASTVAQGALYGTISLLLGALAAWFAGRLGAVDPTLTSSLLLRSRENRRSYARTGT